MPKKKTIYIDMSAEERAKNKELKSNEEIFNEFIEERKAHQEFINNLIKQHKQQEKEKDKRLLKNTREIVKYMREKENEKEK